MFLVNFAAEMKKGKLTYIFGILLTVLFLGPQLYKTFHIFTDHHGHLNCEAMRSPQSGLNGENDHCPICAFQFTTFDQRQSYADQVIPFTFPKVNFEHSDTYHPLKTAFSFQLRAPPDRPVLS